MHSPAARVQPLRRSGACALQQRFSRTADKGGRRDPGSQVRLCFAGRSYSGTVTWYRRGSKEAAYRRWFDDELRYALAKLSS